MSNPSFAKPRPLWRVLILSVVTLMLYYGWYKWIIQEELRRYKGYGWSGTLCLFPFVIGVALPKWRQNAPATFFFQKQSTKISGG